LYFQSSVSSETNWWRRKHKDFIRCHDIRLKIVVLETYLGTWPHVNFAEFFVLNARVLELMTFHIEAGVYSDEFLAEQHRRLQIDNRAARDARFRSTTASCQHAVSGTKHLRDFDLNGDLFTCRC
uniref:FBD domain-containing protein n=1 Tax=Triticum urartu TaxID=4572 RepID=A0A8R7UKC6_TRIUA